MMRLFTLACGDKIHRYQKCIVVPFQGKRRVLSTCPLNGGYREDLSAVFNNDGNPGAGMACVLKAPTYKEHMALIAEEIGLDKETAAGMSTAASMDNVSIQTSDFQELTVTAVVTAGIEVNGGRVGDPALWHEVGGETTCIKLGTINIMLFISSDLTEETLARAVVTCTEAKTAAIQELLAPSRYSMGLATGSGTDGTIVVCNAESQICLSNAGKHNKLGELIGITVKAGVKEALKFQTGLCPESQHNMLKRIDRFGLTEETLWKQYLENSGTLSKPEFSDKLYHLAISKDFVVYSSLFVHLIDQLMWGLLSPQEAVDGGRRLLAILKHSHDKPSLAVNMKQEEAITQMLDDLVDIIIQSILT